MPQQGLVEGSPEVEILEAEGVDLSRVRRIPLDKIGRGSFQPRRSFDMERLKELASDIQARGQVESGIVNDRGDGMFELIAGERRFRALQMTDRKTFRAAVVTITDPKLLVKLAMASNNNREDLNDLDLLETCLELRTKFEMSDGDIASSLQRSVQWVSNTFTLNRLHGKLRSKLGAKAVGGISRSVALQLVRLEPSDQLLVLKSIRKGDMGEKRARRLVDDMLADGSVRQHAAAQDRRTPTEAFMAVVQGSIATARESLTRVTRGSRRKKLESLDAQTATRLREQLKNVSDEIECILSVLP